MLKTSILGKVSLLTIGLASIMQANAQDETWTPKGSGSEEFPYQISSYFDLYNYAKKIEKTENYSKGKFFVLTADISIQDVTIIDENGNLVADTTKLAKWQPIGTEWYGKSFAGTFDGQGHTISGIYVDARENRYSGYAGLFGHMSGTIKNLTITNSYFCGGNYLGAFAGQMNGDDAVIENCVNYATVCGENAPTMQIGGFYGYTYYGSVKNSKNYGKIILSPEVDELVGLWNCSAGGIGGSGGSISECENHGDVISYNWGGVGGIVGSPRYVSTCKNYGKIEDFHGNSIGGINGWSGSIWDCENYGVVISHANGAKIGGIGGQITAGGRIGGCKNFAALISSEPDVWIGGICGYGKIDGYTETYITGCENMGNVTTTDASSHCAGIVPYLYHAEARSCKNYGNVSCESDAGGICALAMAHGSITNSENYASVVGKGYVGGITGEAVESVHGCVNFGDVTLLSGSRVAGIAGYMSSSSSFTIDCANLGNITTFDASMIGGIVGNSSSYGTVRCCYNSGDIISYGDSWMGGIAGYMSNGIYDCYNKGNIVNYGSGSCLAGIAGWSNSSIENAFTTGYLYCLGENETVGYMVSGTYSSFNGYARKRNLYYSNTIVGSPAKYSNSQSAWSFNKIAEEEIAGLTDIFNESREYGDTSGWINGYYHPVLKRYYAIEGSNYDDPEYNYSVTTLSGDTCRIDLGIPFDNTLFKVIEGDNSSLCFNTINGENTVNKMWVVDHRDFEVPVELKIANATMRINDIQGLCSKVLPWDVSKQDISENVKYYEYMNHAGNAVMFTETNEIKAGKATLLQLPDSMRFLSLSKKNFNLSMPEIVKDVFEGAFNDRMSSTSQYLLNAADSIFVRSDGQTMIRTFDAFLNIEDDIADVLAIDLTGSSSVDNIPLDKKSLTINRNGDFGIEVDGLGDKCDIMVYKINGELIYHRNIVDSRILIELPSNGVYVVKVDNQTFKIRI